MAAQQFGVKKQCEKKEKKRKKVAFSIINIQFELPRSQLINDAVKLEIFGKIDELKKNVDQRFEAQSKLIKSVAHDI